jgi:RHS repeat-associated protein
VVADGIRLVAASAQAANIAYIHSDHLGSPQKMTDPSQALTWDAQFDPFGEEFLISGSAVQPNRFPGQYADAESGYSYNYFRDYEPSIGRYLQSDPVGLEGGINSYAYVDSNAVRFTDPRGLDDADSGGRIDVPIPMLYPPFIDTPEEQEWYRDQVDKAAQQIDDAISDVGDAVKDAWDWCQATAETARCLIVRNICIQECSELLDDPRPSPGSDRPTWNFHQCVNECMKMQGCL